MDSDNQQLTEAIRSGDEQAFERAFFIYYEELCRFACRYVRSMFIAEEVVQDVFTVVWEGRAALDPESNFRSYLYQITKHLALDYVRRQEVAQKYELEVERRLYEEVYETERESVTNEDFIEAVQTAIEDLPERTREVYKLSRDDGFTYPEIADILDISVKTVEMHMSKALRILRDRLARYLPAMLLIHILQRFVA